jgi:hypothetical protein
MTRLTHLIKLSVGTEDVADLAQWQGDRRYQTADGLPRHVTRMWPKREAEVLAGGSIYWVIKGLVLCRQRIVRLDRVEGSDGIERCAIVMEPELVRVAPSPKRPFQGWRYLAPGDAPPDLAPVKAGDDVLPPELTRVLAEIGVF